MIQTWCIFKKTAKLVRNKEREIAYVGLPYCKHWKLGAILGDVSSLTGHTPTIEPRSQATPPRLSLEPDWGHSNCSQTRYKQTTVNVTSSEATGCWPWKWYASDVIMARDSYCKHGSFVSVMWLKIFKWLKPALWCSCSELFDVVGFNLWFKAYSGVWFRFLKMIVPG